MTTLLHTSLQYEPDTGLIRWRTMPANQVKPGMIAGTRASNGYIVIQVDGVPYKAHRLAWLLHYGEWPTHPLDHINGLRDDNRISNLRQATCAENNHNSKLRQDNTSGVKGLCFQPHKQAWLARIRHNGQRLSKTSLSREVALAWLIATRERLHMNFSRHQ